MISECYVCKSTENLILDNNDKLCKSCYDKKYQLLNSEIAQAEQEPYYQHMQWEWE